MNELRTVLDREAERVQAPTEALDRLMDRMESRRRRRRTGAGAVALAVAVGGFLVASTFFGHARPAGSGSKRNVSTAQGSDFVVIWPQVTRGDAEIAQSRANRGDDRLTWQQDANEFVARFANDGLSWVAVWADDVSPSAARGNGPLTVALRGCPADAATYSEADQAWSCVESSFRDAQVTIERLLQRDSAGIWSLTAASVDGSPVQPEPSPLPPIDTPSPISDLPQEPGQLLYDFMDARAADGYTASATPYLSQEALDSFEAGEGGLSLYGYLTHGETWEVSGWEKADRGYRIVVQIDRAEGSGDAFPASGLIHETLLIGKGQRADGSHSETVVLSAERNE